MLLLPYLGGVFLLPDCCDPFNEKALRASQGVSFQLPVVSRTWTHLEALRNKFHLKILAGHPESNEQSKPASRLSQGLADSLANFPLCLVLGGEGSGLSAKTRQIATRSSFLLVGDGCCLLVCCICWFAAAALVADACWAAAAAAAMLL